MPETTVYGKLQAVRTELADQAFEKSGENKYSSYSYYELSDFIKQITRLCGKHQLCTAFDFSKHFAVLKIFNIEKPDEVIKFHSPMAKAEVKGCQEIQNLGAIETYERRYLYIMAFDISEPDGLEPRTGNTKSQETTTDKYISRDQATLLWEAIKTKFGANANGMIKTLTMHDKLSEIPAKDFDSMLEVVKEYRS